MYPTQPRCKIRFSFLLLCGWFAWACGTGMLLSVLLCAAVHELGHLAVLRLCGCRVREFRVGILGAVIEADTSRLSYGRELLAVLAGPFANLFFAVAMIRAGEEVLAGANIVLCGFNLLPLPLLDGGRALGLILAWGLGPDRGEAVLRRIGTVSALVLSVFLLFLMVGTGGSLWLLPTCAASAALVRKDAKIQEKICKKPLQT